MRLTIAIMMSLLFISCDEYLDIHPKGYRIPTSVEDYQGMLRTELILDYSEARFLDDISMPNGYWWLDGGSPIAEAHFYGNESFNRIERMNEAILYTFAYSSIKNCNIILEGINDVKGTEQFKKQVEAQARLLRAYYHFFIVNTYAVAYDKRTAAQTNGIVYVDEFNLETAKPQLKIEEVYQRMLTDVNKSLENLPLSGETHRDPTKAFGYAFKAKLHLFMGDYQQALSAANESLSYNHVTVDLVEYAKTFQPMAIYLKDNLFVLLHGTYQSGNDFSAWNKLFVEKFEEGDIRKEMGMQEAEEQNLKDTYIFKTGNKYVPNTAGMRSSEVLLMKAECLAREGKLKEALEVMHSLRVNRIKADKYKQLTTDLLKNKVQVMHAIMDERAKEMMGSMNRYWDIKRLAKEADYRIVIQRTFIDDKGKRVNISLQPDSHLLTLPFPMNVMDLNPNLQHNSK